MKSLLWKSGDPFLAILAYSATPLQSGFSPAELLMRCKLRTTIPMVREQRMQAKSRWDDHIFTEKDNALKERQRDNFDSHHGAKELPPLSLGDKMWIPDRETTGQVLEEVAPRSLVVETPDGTYRRNPKHLIQLPDPEPMVEPQANNLPEPNTESTCTYQTHSKSGRAPKPPPERLDPSWT